MIGAIFGVASMGGSLLGGIMGGDAAEAQAAQAAAMARYRAKVAENNAKIAIQEGRLQAKQTARKNEIEVDKYKSRFVESGFEASSGSVAKAIEFAEDEMAKTVASNFQQKMSEAQNYQSQAAMGEYEAQAAIAQGKNDKKASMISGIMGAVSTGISTDWQS